ncbi:NADH-cytochrome b5 reductase-like [Leguminivora glycinivorella]|uniref:NADH-cytochrome b5 reductase-like n=1 Tax=Leguminivora glycinivorella TaxID=1035111 RepID=UPI00200F0ADF|nr:NADH-cytochrome b5 reductase-like [Leguminivora glycinivorella]
MRQPIEPSKEDCCNSGCNPCVFDVYEKQLKLYEAYLKNGESPGVLEDNAISQLEYTNFTLVKNLELCSFHKILAFKTTESVIGKKLSWKPGDHFLVKYNAGGEVCSRAYTPIKYCIENEDYDFVVIVKKYENGCVSSYLCNMTPGQESLWRGPYGSFNLVPNKFEKLIMIAQGTGIAPFYSIIQDVLSNEDDYTKIVLFFCCSSPETIILRNELYSFKSYWNFQYNIFVNKSNCTPKYQEPIHNRKLEFTDLKLLEPFSSNDQFLLCGSTSFINIFKSLITEANYVSCENIISF